MRIPVCVQFCLDRLEHAGFAACLVGGCVRDTLLGLEPADYDLCTSGVPDQTKAVFSDCRLSLAGEKHGTVAVILDGRTVEITTFRTEGGYADHRHPEWVSFVPTVEADLARRDFTVNAMAFSPSRGLTDPFGGQDDLAQHRLRCVGVPEQRFQEDPLRILRGVRFAVKYRLTPEPETMAAMVSQRHLMDDLARERIFDELCKLLPLLGADDLIRYAPILAAVIPELGPMIGFDQRSPHHAYDLFTHTARVCAAVPADLPLRWAALLHDTGKIPTFTQDETGRGHFYGHAKASAALSGEILRRLKAPKRLQGEVVQLVELHMTRIPADKKVVRRYLGKLGSTAMHRLLALQEADMGSKGTDITQETAALSRLRAVMAEVEAEDACLCLKDLCIGGNDLIALGFAPGPALGACLRSLLDGVLDGYLPNEKDALRSAAIQKLNSQNKEASNK